MDETRDRRSDARMGMGWGLWTHGVMRMRTSEHVKCRRAYVAWAWHGQASEGGRRRRALFPKAVTGCAQGDGGDIKTAEGAGAPSGNEDKVSDGLA